MLLVGSGDDGGNIKGGNDGGSQGLSLVEGIRGGVGG